MTIFQMSCLFMTNYRLLYQTTVEDLLCKLKVEIIQAFLKYEVFFELENNIL